MTEPATIIIQGLSKSFGNAPVLRGIDLEVRPGELTVLVGPSGCGKSTLLRCLNGLEIFDSGKVSVNGVTLDRRHPVPAKDGHYRREAQNLRRHVGMVFQSFNLFPHLTLLENVAKAPVVVKGLPREDAETRARGLIEKVGLGGHAHHYPSQLSGGQQQRGAIARALAMSPKVMLYDEPTSALDPNLTGEVWQVMRGLDDEGMTQVVVTHEYRWVREMADRVIFLDAGLIAEDAPPEGFFTAPRNPRAREFLRHELEGSSRASPRTEAVTG